MRGMRSGSNGSCGDWRVISLLGPEMAPWAARNHRRLRSLGITVRKLVDIAIGTFWIERRCALLHADRDFERMNSTWDFRSWRIEGRNRLRDPDQTTGSRVAASITSGAASKAAIRLSAALSGLLRPCSQFCSVSRSMPITAARRRREKDGVRATAPPAHDPGGADDGPERPVPAGRAPGPECPRPRRLCRRRCRLRPNG